MPSRRATRPDDKRLSRNKPPVQRKAPKSRHQMLMDGDITVDDLDMDEIMMGRTKDKNGGFTGRPADKYPRAILDAMRRRWFDEVQKSLNEQTELAVATLADVMASRHAAAPARVRAAEIILERNLGKVPDKIQSTVELKKFEEDIEGLLVEVDETNVYQITSKKERSA